MEVSEQIKKFQNFIDGNCKAELLENIRKEKNFLVIDFSELSKFSPELASLLLDQPEEVISAAKLAIEEFDVGDVAKKSFNIRFSNLPESQKIMIRNIRSKHIGKFFWFEGAVRQKSDVRPQVTSARFECPSCGNIINVLQLDSNFKEPTRCGCQGSRGILVRDCG